MTTRSPDRLFDLLPVVHRQRDADRGYPLRALLQVIAEQVDVVENDMDSLYENWFIETCEDWVVPYLGDVIGYRPVREVGGSSGLTPERQRLLNRIMIPRREVANTLRYRRRKGTLALLELLAHDIAGWPARAVEFYRLLAWMQPLNHQRLARGRSADLRSGEALDLIDGPFDQLAHTVDVRRISSHRTGGRYNIPSVGVFVWRLRAYPVTRSPAYCHEAIGSHCYTFSVLGNDSPLYTKPSPEPSPDHIAGALNVPAPIRRRALERDLDGYYGTGRSFAIWVDGWAGHGPDAPLPPDAIIVADLSDWRYRAPRDRVAVDPVLGRIAFPLRQLPKKGVWVSYHYGFSDDTGGGEYARTLSQPAGAVIYRVGEGEEYPRINDALVHWREEAPADAVIEITDGGVYVEQISVELSEGQSLQLRAADRTRPVLRLMDWQTARPDALWVRGDENSSFTLDGLLVAGRSVQCEGPLAEITIRHSTLVPGWTIGPHCEPGRPAEPSLELIDTRACVAIERSILGSIQVSQDEVATDPISIRISDSVLDATARDRSAIGAPSWPMAHAILVFERTTVVGEIETHAIRLAEDSIFLGRIRVARRQIGCMRFCYVTPGSRTPRRYHCQPDLAERTALEALPSSEIGPTVRAGFGAAASTDEPESCGCAADAANLDLTFEVDNHAPTIGDVLTFTLTVDNRGPRSASMIEITVGAPTNDCFETEGEAVLSQGTLDEAPSENDGLWRVGALEPGGRAMLTARVRLTGICNPPVLTATISAHTFSDDGGAYRTELVRRVRQRVQPRFNSTRYGTPTYAQLALTCPTEIAAGADDESEMGAFHDLFQPQRAANLDARLAEFVPAGMDVGVIYVT